MPSVPAKPILPQRTCGGKFNSKCANGEGACDGHYQNCNKNHMCTLVTPMMEASPTVTFVQRADFGHGDIPRAGLNHYCVATKCLGCAQGQYQDEVGMVGCKDCPSGMYQDATGRSTCRIRAAVTGGVGASVLCPAGKFGVRGSSSDVDLACLDCPVGLYSEVAGVAQCKNCPIGKYSDAEGVNTLFGCKSCADGKSSKGAKLANGEYCESCAAGQFALSIQTLGCLGCPVGQFSTVATVGQLCKDCPPGKLAIASGSRACTACLPGWFDPSYDLANSGLCQYDALRLTTAALPSATAKASGGVAVSGAGFIVSIPHSHKEAQYTITPAPDDIGGYTARLSSLAMDAEVKAAMAGSKVDIAAAWFGGVQAGNKPIVYGIPGFASGVLKLDATPLNFGEVQTLTCTAAEGSFTLSRGFFTTAPVPWNATAAQVKAELEALSNIGSVAVSFSRLNRACDAPSSVDISVSFTSSYIDEAPLVADVSALFSFETAPGTITVEETRKGGGGPAPSPAPSFSSTIIKTLPAPDADAGNYMGGNNQKWAGGVYIARPFPAPGGDIYCAPHDKVRTSASAAAASATAAAAAATAAAAAAL